MTKTLTEQWREGTLLTGCYYVLSTEDDTPVACDIDVVSDFMIRDVIASVPSYDEYQRLVSNSDESVQKMHILEKQLAIATKALKIYDNKLNWDIRGVSFMKYNKGFTLARKALKEMEGVK